MDFVKETESEIVWCCARDCKSNSKEYQHSLFSLPSDNESAYLWLKNANRFDLLENECDLNLSDSIKICAAHFEANMFQNLNKNCLVANAVPTVFELGQQNIYIENPGITIMGEVIKIDPFFEESETNSDPDNREIDGTAEIDAEQRLDISNRSSTVIYRYDRIKHVVSVPEMDSEYLKNNLNNNENGEHNYADSQDNEKSVDLDEDYPEDHTVIEEALNNKNKKRSRKAKITEISKKSARKKIPKHSKKTSSTLKESVNKRLLKDKNSVEIRRRDFFKMCRICFNDDINKLVDINNSKCQGKTFANLLENNKNYEPNIIKNIPRFICLKCSEDLLESHNFFVSVQKSATILYDTYKTLSESSNRKAIRISNWKNSMLTLEDCVLETFAVSIRSEDLNVIKTIKMERNGYDSDKFNNDPNDDSYWSDEDYDSLIKIKRINALKYGLNNDSNNDDTSREFIGKIEVITEDDEDASSSDCSVVETSRKRKRKYSTKLKDSKKANTRTNRPRLPKDYVPSEHDLTCSDCKKVFPNRASLGSHQRNVHVTVECKVCGMRLKGASIRWHMRVMHSMVNGVEDREKAAPKKVLCVKCGKWVRAHKYKIHLKTHMVTKPFACDICDYRTADKHRLIPHKLLHTGEKPHLCATCGEGFHRKDYLKVHVALHTTLDVPVTCNTCPQTFGTKFEYHTHRRLVHGYQKVGALPRVRLINGETVQPVQKSNTRSCHICHKVFPRNNKSFYVHMREHIPRPVRCTMCNKQCNSAEALKSHVRTHTGEKPFKCKLCDKAYSQYGHLQSHRATFHENKRAFKCEFCDKAFNLSIGLKEHIRIHTGETLDCEHCGKAFRQRSNFYKHLREVHSIRKRELNREQSATQNNPPGSTSDCLTVLTNAALTD